VERLEAVRSLGHSVDPPENQGGISQVELCQPIEHGLVEDVALVTGLERATQGAFVQVAHAPGRIAADFEAPVGVVDELLFGGKIGVLLRHGSYNSIGPFLVVPPIAHPAVFCVTPRA